MIGASKILEVASEMALPHAVLESIAQRYDAPAARACAMSVSVGGIGPLMKDRIVGQSEQGIDVIGVSLLYENVWIQMKAKPGQIHLESRPVGDILRSVLARTDLGFNLTCFDGTNAEIEVWACPMGNATGYYLSCPEITNIVYPGRVDAPEGEADPGFWAHAIKLKHNWLLGRGALMLSKRLARKPDVVILSETPTTFAHNRFFVDAFQKDPFFSATKYVFNDHTPLEYAHPLWDAETIRMVKLDPALYESSQAWNTKTQHLDLTAFIVERSDAVYGVAKKHGDVMRAMPSLKPHASKIAYVTNGVRSRDWQAPDLQNADDLTDEDLLARKDGHRKALFSWLAEIAELPKGWTERVGHKKVGIVTRRITPYKRLDVLVRIMKEEPLRRRFLELELLIVVGGRIHQQDDKGYGYASELVRAIAEIPRLAESVVFIPNFNIWEAPKLYRGADAALMISDDTMEASATGFMKAQMNGAAVIATSDGAVPEFVDFFGPENAADANGFLIPYVKGQPTSEGLLSAMTEFDRTLTVPANRARIIRAAIAKTPGLEIGRTVRDMNELFSRMRATAGPV